MRMLFPMRGWIVSITALWVVGILAGCGESRSQAIGRCQLEAYRIYPVEQRLLDRALVINACMRASGYTVALVDGCELGRAECWDTEWEAWWRKFTRKDDHR
ncbi:hypothetical protein RSO01_66650 [Reyranella soli]|uniref:Lipoprotein n=1 Tax=Reyranella soli TaxID=1230389 RepID=A0A512NKM7_9HYPH|nr:hypothetical protein RSO01_66650 [Reyranella soli]